MTEVTIKSAQDHLRLVLGPAEGTNGDGQFRVGVYDMHYDTLADFFGSMAADWRGWEGVRSWYSLEGHLELEAKADRLGHVALRVRLRAMDLASEWDVSTTLLLEAGQLDAIAADARKVFDAADVA